MLPRQTLLMDADDTLWENNVYFEESIASFLSLLDHTPHTPVDLRDRLNAIERETVAEHGYGTQSFHRSLLRCYEELTGKPLDEHDCKRIQGFARSIAEAEIQLLPGVAESLPLLARRHRLVLVTKGDNAEQADKLGRSGLAPHFAAVEILREKNAEAYRAVAGRQRCSDGATWMIGNSPRSDINPALEAGLHAAYLRYHSTWILEEEELAEPRPGQRLLVCDDFRQMARELIG